MRSIQRFLPSDTQYSGPETPNPKPQTRNPRKGVTLTEVLIAMFVMAIGLMGILALFPLGAAQMANAVKDERTLQAAQVGEGHARVLWRLAFPSVNTQDYALPGQITPPPPYAFTTEPALRAFDNPDPQFILSPLLQGQEIIQSFHRKNTPGPPIQFPGSTEPSFPIYFDPIGYSTQTGNSQVWVGGIFQTMMVNGASYQTGLPRRTISQLNGLTAAQQTTLRIRLFSLMDDLTFDKSGKAAIFVGGQIERAGRFNTAVLIQRSSNGGSNPTNRTRANISVVVYQNRPVADTASAETPLALNQPIFPGSTTLAFSSAGLPALRRGTWILVTGQIVIPAGQPYSNPTHPVYAYANFYRIVSVQDNGGNYQLEVFPPLKDNIPPKSHWTPAQLTSGYPTYPGNIIALDNVAEVFERPLLTAPLP